VLRCLTVGAQVVWMDGSVKYLDAELDASCANLGIGTTRLKLP
jgi:hypothetical protein